MKMNKLVAAIAASAVSVGAFAVPNADGSLAGTGSENLDGGIQAVSAIAIIGDTCLIESLQKAQGLPAACIGNTTTLCAPTMSSAEIRGYLNSSWSNAGALTGVSGDVDSFMGSCTIAVTKTVLRNNQVLDGVIVDAALNEFVSGGAVFDGLSCGQGNGLRGVDNTDATAAATIATVAAVDNRADIGFIHATDLSSNTDGYGFIKLDGVAPDLVNLMSSNYNLTQNVHDIGPVSVTTNAFSMTLGTAPVASGDVAFHNIGGLPNACGPLHAGGASDVNGGGL